MNHLKSTPWLAIDDVDGFWFIMDKDFDHVAKLIIEEENAKAITALPETLDRLQRLEKAFEDTLRDLEKRKQNIIDNKSAMPQFMQEGGVMAFESSIDVVKDNLKKALEE